MNPEAKTPITFPPALLARLEEAAQEAGKSPAELVEGWLERDQKERSWVETLRYGSERGAQLLPPDASEEAVSDLVNAKIAESRQERRGR